MTTTSIIPHEPDSVEAANKAARAAFQDAIAKVQSLHDLLVNPSLARIQSALMDGKIPHTKVTL
jgi:hypothetical protein